MSKKLKLIIILASSIFLILFWAVLFFSGTKYQTINYVWQAMFAFIAVLFGIFGLISAKHWGWLKSGVGQGVFCISLGVIAWGLGQAFWTYYVITNPSVEAPSNRIIDVLYFSSIPLWIYGILRLSKATGARYGLKNPIAKIGVAVLAIFMFAISYYLLVVVARGGSEYFEGAVFLDVLFDLGYAAGDAINLLLALAIFGLSWKYLGGMFKKPILLILLSFASVYLADMFYSYRNAQEIYYNGDVADLFYLLTIVMFGIGLSLIDPNKNINKPVRVDETNNGGSTPLPVTPVTNQQNVPAQPQAPIVTQQAVPVPAVQQVTPISESPVPPNPNSTSVQNVERQQLQNLAAATAVTIDTTTPSSVVAPTQAILPDANTAETFAAPQIGTTITPQVQVNSDEQPDNQPENQERI